MNKIMNEKGDIPRDSIEIQRSYEATMNNCNVNKPEIKRNGKILRNMQFAMIESGRDRKCE